MRKEQRGSACRSPNDEFSAAFLLCCYDFHASCSEGYSARATTAPPIRTAMDPTVVLCAAPVKVGCAPAEVGLGTTAVVPLEPPVGIGAPYEGLE